MGTADYCMLVVLLFFALMAWSLRVEEKRRRERRKTVGPPPGGIERRCGRDRRSESWIAYVTWATRSRWKKLKSRFKVQSQ